MTRVKLNIHCKSKAVKRDIFKKLENYFRENNIYCTTEFDLQNQAYLAAKKIAQQKRLRFSMNGDNLYFAEGGTK